MALILSGLASIPRWEMRKPSSLPDGTPNAHLSGLSLKLTRRRLSKVSCRSWMRESFYRVLTTMSSMRGRGNGYLGQALFRSMKSMQSRSLEVIGFGTTTGLATQVG